MTAEENKGQEEAEGNEVLAHLTEDDNKGKQEAFDGQPEKKVFKCPECGSDVITQFAGETIVTDMKIRWNPEAQKIETEEVNRDVQPTSEQPDYACAGCSNQISWREIKEALEPKQNQTTLFPMSSPEPPKETQNTEPSVEESQCATSVEKDVSPAESSLNNTEKKT